jgi:sugar O-acyltransferase (sialic acid O-acetyltransferase NeuD family)
LDYEVAAVFDDDDDKCGLEILGIRVEGPIDDVRAFPRRPTVIAVGNNRTRAAIADRLDLDWLTVVHPKAHVDPTATLGAGTMVFAGAVVQADTYIGSHVIINTSASIDHDCHIDDFVHIAPGARFSGGVEIGQGTLMGIGSIVIPERSIGSWATVGAGAVVTKNLPDKVTAVGVPARVVAQRGCE